ncbi:MAG: hypothetical protein LBB26_03985 [Puniceicoccales bacterium]|jgi:hypothetical protein|nr:hypothetical protein [Puniceicoccales bacterium]
MSVDLGTSSRPPQAKEQPVSAFDVLQQVFGGDLLAEQVGEQIRELLDVYGTPEERGVFNYFVANPKLKTCNRVLEAVCRCCRRCTTNQEMAYGCLRLLASSCNRSTFVTPSELTSTLKTVGTSLARARLGLSHNGAAKFQDARGWYLVYVPWGGKLVACVLKDGRRCTPWVQAVDLCPPPTGGTEDEVGPPPINVGQGASSEAELPINEEPAHPGERSRKGLRKNSGPLPAEPVTPPQKNPLFEDNLDDSLDEPEPDAPAEDQTLSEESAETSDDSFGSDGLENNLPGKPDPDAPAENPPLSEESAETSDDSSGFDGPENNLPGKPDPDAPAEDPPLSEESAETPDDSSGFDGPGHNRVGNDNLDDELGALEEVVVLDDGLVVPDAPLVDGKIPTPGGQPGHNSGLRGVEMKRKILNFPLEPLPQPTPFDPDGNENDSSTPKPLVEEAASVPDEDAPLQNEPDIVPVEEFQETESLPQTDDTVPVGLAEEPAEKLAEEPTPPGEPEEKPEEVTPTGLMGATTDERVVVVPVENEPKAAGWDLAWRMLGMAPVAGVAIALASVTLPLTGAAAVSVAVGAGLVVHSMRGSSGAGAGSGQPFVEETDPSLFEQNSVPNVQQSVESSIKTGSLNFSGLPKSDQGQVGDILTRIMHTGESCVLEREGSLWGSGSNVKVRGGVLPTKINMDKNPRAFDERDSAEVLKALVSRAEELGLDVCKGSMPKQVWGSATMYVVQQNPSCCKLLDFAAAEGVLSGKQRWKHNGRGYSAKLLSDNELRAFLWASSSTNSSSVSKFRKKLQFRIVEGEALLWCDGTTFGEIFPEGTA